MGMGKHWRVFCAVFATQPMLVQYMCLVYPPSRMHRCFIKTNDLDGRSIAYLFLLFCVFLTLLVDS